jgi:hypothetical protein
MKGGGKGTTGQPAGRQGKVVGWGRAAGGTHWVGEVDCVESGSDGGAVVGGVDLCSVALASVTGGMGLHIALEC